MYYVIVYALCIVCTDMPCSPPGRLAEKPHPPPPPSADRKKSIGCGFKNLCERNQRL
jgi:hypothetical protein